MRYDESQGGTMLRPDIEKAIYELPAEIKEQITTLGSECLDLLNSYLSADEQVQYISSASPRPDTAYNCLLAVTNRRLIFLAPAPQAVGWRLSAITRAQSHGGYFFVEGDAGEYSPGLDSNWGRTFEAQVKRAAAIAVLAAE
jgi:hypothetical protein